MVREELLEKVKLRRKEVGITIDNLANLSGLGLKTLTRFLAGADVKLSTVEKLTNVLGLDFSGNEIVDVNTLKNNKAEEKAKLIVSLVQDTLSLENQGLDTQNIEVLLEETKQQFLTGEYKKNLWKK